MNFKGSTIDSQPHNSLPQEDSRDCARREILDARQLSQLLDLQQTILESITLGKGFSALLQALCRMIEAMIPQSLASIMLLDNDRKTMRFKSGPSIPEEIIKIFDGIRPSENMGSCSNAILTGAPVCVSDVPSDPRWDGVRQLAAAHRIGSCWSIPIFAENRYLLGTFAITSEHKRAPTPFHTRVLDTSSYLAGIIIRNWQREQRLLQWNAVFDNASEGMVITDINGLIIDVNQSFTKITGYTPDEVKGRTPHVLNSGKHDKSFFQALWASLAETGRWQGEIWNRRKSGDVYPEWLSVSRIQNREGETCNYVGVFSDISSLKESERKLYHMAHHDPLTGLPNRLLMTARLEHAIGQAKRNPARLAVLFLDLDRFKNINDAYGHEIGDQLLVNVASRLKVRLREQDTIARLGGDEFVVILEQIQSADCAMTIASSFIESLSRPFNLVNNEVYATPSIGIAMYPEDGTESDTLIKNADIAMYRAKEQGRHRYCLYTPTLSSRLEHRLSYETLLRRALERNEFQLFYQPQVRAVDRKILGAEVLLRWHHPEQGLQLPGMFIPVLEEADLMDEVGNWVLNSACQQLREWRQKGLPQIRLAVNLSAKQISPGYIRDQLPALLSQYQLGPQCLELEITEHNIMESGEQATQLIASLRDLGISLAIDDFGTGYSSLARLKRLPVHCLKIDRSLVRDIPLDTNDQAICRAVVALGHSLGIRIVAEGVEVEEQADFLLQINCDELQGYLYGRPMESGEFEHLLRRQLSTASSRPVTCR